MRPPVLRSINPDKKRNMYTATKIKNLSTIPLAISGICVTFLTGCASLPKNDLTAQNREKLHSIAVLQVSEPRAENVWNLGGAAGAFGLVGGIVQAGINSSHSTTYTQKAASEKILFAPIVNDGIVSRLSSDGYQIVKLSDQKVKLSADGKSDDYSAIQTDADAILNVWFTSFGYVSPPESTDFMPWVVVRARLLDAKTKQDMYFKTFACGYDIKANSVHIDAEATYRYGSFSKLEDQFDQSVTGLQACEQAVVAMIGQEFAKSQ